MSAIHEPTMIKIKVLGDLNIPVKEIEKFNVRISGKYMVIDNAYFVSFNRDMYSDFCRRVGYTVIQDNFPESIDEKPDNSEESLIAYAYNCKGYWLSFNDEIEKYQFKIDELLKLRG